jgi:hypothetical protein
MKYFWLFAALFISHFLFSQTKIKGQVIDFDTTIPIAFAKITHDGKTIIADWEGKFAVDVIVFEKPIIASYKGYYDKSAYAKKSTALLLIKLITNTKERKAALYTNQKVNTIIKKVIDHKKKNQPEHVFKSFEYKNYEYLKVSANPDSISGKIDTIYKRNFFGKQKIKLDSSNYRFKKLVEKNHMYQTEKVNLIQHNEKGTKETILASRMAGFKQPLYEYLGLHLVSYSVYENPFEILEIPMQNPISNFGRKLYNYTLIDSTTIENRKVYRVYFQPKKLRANKLRGLLYVDATTFAVAKAHYRVYGIVNINAYYDFKYLKEHQIWFPEKTVFNVQKGTNTGDLKILGSTIQFNNSIEEGISKNASDQAYLTIESTPFDVAFNKDFVISEPKIKIEVPESSLSQPEKYWEPFTKDINDKRKSNTYISLDSLSMASKIEHKLFLGRKIINGYFPVSIVDVDLRSIVKYNNFEGFRLGIGGVTNNKLAENYKIGFYGAYGLKDREFKYGISPSYLLNKKSETWVTASYSDDLEEIAQTSFATDSRRFRIYDPRPINISTFYNIRTSALSLESKILPKTNSYFAVSQNYIQPLFDYTYINNDKIYTDYNINSVQFAIQWNPFSNYMRTPMGMIENEKRQPKFSFQVMQTLPDVVENDFTFTKVDFKTFYEIPYLSGHKSSVLLQAGWAFGDIPLTHMYSIAPNNINRDAILQRITFAGKNSFETMYYNEFFSNRYASLQLRHTFNKVNLAYKIAPEFSVVTRMAWGEMDNTEKHIGLPFNTLERGFFESGIEANKIFKGLGINAFFRYGPYQLPRFDDNLSIKISYFLDLGI